MLAARRRLLGMLLVLALSSGALAVTKMAAWWVIVPPFIMLTGYLALLREASKSDAERRELARTRAAEAAARRAAPPAAAATAGAAPRQARLRPRPRLPQARRRQARRRPHRPHRLPRLLPQYRTPRSSTSPRRSATGGEEFYDQYADAKLRAVGDLPSPPPSRAVRESWRASLPVQVRATRLDRGTNVSCGA